MFTNKREFYLDGAIIFEDGIVEFKYKNINARKLTAIRNGSFMLFKGTEFIETDRYIPNLSYNHLVRLQDGRELRVQTIEPVEENRKNMYKTNGYTGLMMVLG